MRCFHFSYPERKGGYFKNRFSWNFFSQGSSASALEARKSTDSSRRPQIVSEPAPESTSEYPLQPLSQSSSQRPEPRVFTYAELRAATKNFSRSNLLGEGGFGCVYKGLIKRRNSSEVDQEIAVKQLNSKGQQGHKEWLAEVRYLGLVEHPNLVKLVGYCAEDDERGIQRLLVYEFMPNRSLEDHLFRNVPSVLSWHERLSVILGAACGLAYLHEEIDGIQIQRMTSLGTCALDWLRPLAKGHTTSANSHIPLTIGYISSRMVMPLHRSDTSLSLKVVPFGSRVMSLRHKTCLLAVSLRYL